MHACTLPSAQTQVSAALVEVLDELSPQQRQQLLIPNFEVLAGHC